MNELQLRARNHGHSSAVISKFNLYKINLKIYSDTRFSLRIIRISAPGATVDNPKYLRFTKHLENCSNRALKKLRILNSLCGTNWGTTPKTLKTTYTALIRPNFEYAAPIWAHASETVLSKLGRIQAKAAKIIFTAVSSTNNT
ncbi:reverse transcriptase domain-containing protein [Nephila pilipes]|uniref:Reverse transcriptase domain-containing protein n=1 Tax=Nephila pilipes TaxID=299642 RepID=A0A8X6IKY5_NEPPI|nr:reverse transcriptase domain-containing protein [Nephila pilipes]